MQLNERIQDAIRHHEFTLYYQPIINLRTGETVAYEALSRWHDGTEYVPPAVFLPRIVGSKYERDFVIDQLKIIQKTMHRIPLSTAISLNISIGALHWADLPGMIKDYIKRPDRLWLEIPETASLRALQLRLPTLAALQRQGHSLKIDDMGARQAWLDRFQLEVFDGLKIDGSLVAGSARDKYKQAIIAGISTAANMVKLTRIAEGIESPEDAAVCRRMGIDLGQGFLFGRPTVL